MRFLIVDDSSTMRRIIINTLNKLGHKDVQEASNGKEGLERLTSGPVDMIVTERREGRHRRSAQSRGQQLYVVKPFTPETLKEKIEAAPPSASTRRGWPISTSARPGWSRWHVRLSRNSKLKVQNSNKDRTFLLSGGAQSLFEFCVLRFELRTLIDMQLRTARVCLDCEEVHDAQQCPTCASETFAYLTRWVPVPERRQRPRPAEPANRETVDTYREMLTPQRSSGWSTIRRGALGLAIFGVAGWMWRRNAGTGDRESGIGDQESGTRKKP